MYKLVCVECGTIEADTTETGFFEDVEVAQRRAGFHEGIGNPVCSVTVASGVQTLTEQVETEGSA